MTAHMLASVLALATSIATAHAADPATASAPPADVPLPKQIQVPPPDRPDWVRRVDVRSQTDGEGDSKLSVSSVQPLYVPDKSDTVFTQLHVDRNDQATDRSRVSNLGLGYRKLLRDDLMIGVGGFHDRDWTAASQRTGADAELKWQALELSANYYLPGDPFAPSSRTHPQPGTDVSVSSQVPFLPWVHASIGASDVLAPGNGHAGYMTGMQLDLVRNLQFEVGTREMATENEDRYARLRFTLGGTAPDPRQHYLLDDDPVAATPFESRDLSSRMLDRVKAVDGN